MSETTFAIVITISLLIATLAWVPFLHLCCWCLRGLAGGRTSDHLDTTRNITRLGSEDTTNLLRS